MKTQADLASDFRTLHLKGDPVVLYNIWDAGSAKAVAEAGAKAIATGSAPAAMANGYSDGQALPLDLALANVARITAAVSLPVSMDFEGGYALEPEAVTANFSRAVTAGAVGFNFEDQIVGGDGLYAIDVQARRIKAARQGCDTNGVGAFLNARTDVFLKAYAAKKAPTREMLADVVARAKAYADAGADGFFTPGLLDLDMITELCSEVTLPVNIIALPGAPSNAELAKAGVARISYGPVPYRQMSAWLTEQARAVFAGG